MPVLLTDIMAEGLGGAAMVVWGRLNGRRERSGRGIEESIGRAQARDQ